MAYRGIYDACKDVTEGRHLRTIVDLGARHGEGYDVFGRTHPEATYYMVEPSSRCLAVLNRRASAGEFSASPRAHVLSGVLGLEPGRVTFHVLDNDNDQSGNLYGDRGGQYGKASTEDVDVIPYASLPERIDFVKCNVEGAEYDLIETGFFDRVDSFVMELHNCHVKDRDWRNAHELLKRQFSLTSWGNQNYKYCFVNGIRLT